MSNARPRPILDLAGLLGEPAQALSERFGPPSVDRVSGEDRWMVYEGDFGSLRVRARPNRAGGPSRVRSWSLALDEAYDTLDDACRALGLRPAVEVDPPRGAEALARRPLPDPATGRIHSLTAVQRDGVIRTLAAFDEPPDWVETTGLP